MTTGAKLLCMLIILVSLALMFSGCAPGGLFLPDLSKMSAEQMQAMKDLGYDAVRCATLSGGPPVQGRVTTITIPRDRTASVKLGGDCQAQGVDVGGQAGVPTLPGGVSILK